MKILTIGNIDKAYSMEEARQEGMVCPICGENRSFGDCVKAGNPNCGICEDAPIIYEYEGGILRRIYRHTVIRYVKLIFHCCTCNSEWESSPIEICRYEKEGIL